MRINGWRGNAGGASNGVHRHDAPRVPEFAKFIHIPISTSDSDGASSDTKEDGDNGTSVSDDNASDGDNVVVVFGDLPRPVAYNTLVMYDPKLFN